MKTKLSLLYLMIVGLLGSSVSAQVVDSIIDVRDGQTYTVVKIGEQWWMAENLNVGTMVYSIFNQTDNDTIEKYVYNDLAGNADTYGGLYLWDEMMQYDSTEGAQGICPAGWHVPSDTEWVTMEMELGMPSNEAYDEDWRGTDEGTQLLAGGTSNFNAILSGYRSGPGAFSGLAVASLLWSSSDYLGIYGIRRQLQNGAGTIYRTKSTPKDDGLCVRCVADSGFDVPVELNLFRIKIENGVVVLNWKTATEDGNLGFNIQRSASSTGPFIQINDGIIPGAGTTALPQSYSFSDFEAPAGEWYYRLEQVDIGGSIEYSDPVSIELINVGINSEQSLRTDSYMNNGQLYNLCGQKVNVLKPGMHMVRIGKQFKKILILK